MVAYNDPADSPFNPKIPDLTPETPELQHVILDAMRAISAQINVCVPARVHAVHSDQTVDIQPLPRVLYATATKAQDRAILPNVPVSMPMGGDWGITVPVAVGDLGLALFADRNIDGYLAGDGSTTYGPSDLRLHSICDAIFLPGLPTTQQNTDEQGDMVLRNGKASVRIAKDGTVAVQNDSQELLTVLDSLAGLLSSLADTMATQAFTNTLMGPQPFIPSTVDALQALKAQIDIQQQNLETLKR